MTLGLLHIIGRVIGILTGFVALFALKGAILQRKSGRFSSTQCSLSGAVMAYWLWRHRRKRMSRTAVSVTAPQAV